MTREGGDSGHRWSGDSVVRAWSASSGLAKVGESARRSSWSRPGGKTEVGERRGRSLESAGGADRPSVEFADLLDGGIHWRCSSVRRKEKIGKPKSRQDAGATKSGLGKREIVPPQNPGSSGAKARSLPNC